VLQLWVCPVQHLLRELWQVLVAVVGGDVDGQGTARWGGVVAEAVLDQCELRRQCLAVRFGETNLFMAKSCLTHGVGKICCGGVGVREDADGVALLSGLSGQGDDLVIAGA
jgi:hypothetical protein